MGLAGEEELDGVVGVVDDFGEALEVGEEQVGALVGGETAGEAYHEGVGVDLVDEGDDARGVALVLEPRFAEAAAYVLDELGLEAYAGVPDFLVGDVVDAAPDGFVALVGVERGVEVVVVELFPLLGAPGGEVYAVGDVADVVFLRVVSAPDAGEHLLADGAVEAADAVDFLAGFAEEGGHAEALAVVVGVGAAEADEVVPRDAEAGGVAAHVFAEEGFVEVVVAGGHGGVDGVEGGGADELEGFVEAVSALDVVDEALHVAEGGVAFVAVVDVLADAEFLEHEHAADAEEVFLLEAVLPVAAVEGVGDFAVELGVHLVVGVEEVELDAAYVDLPYVGVDLVVGEGHVDDDLVALGVEEALNGEGVEVLGLVVGDLLAVHGEGLAEVAVAVEEADAAEVDVAVGGFLEVVAGEDAEASGVDFQDVVEAVLHAEVGDGGAAAVGLDVEVLAEGGVDGVEAGHEALVLGELDEAVVAEAVEQLDGVLADFAEEVLVDAAEEVEAFAVPCPPEVARHFLELLERGGDVGLDGDDSPVGVVGVVYFDFHVGFLISL